MGVLTELLVFICIITLLIYIYNSEDFNGMPFYETRIISDIPKSTINLPSYTGSNFEFPEIKTSDIILSNDTDLVVQNFIDSLKGSVLVKGYFLKVTTENIGSKNMISEVSTKEQDTINNIISIFTNNLNVASNGKYTFSKVNTGNFTINGFIYTIPLFLYESVTNSTKAMVCVFKINNGDLILINVTFPVNGENKYLPASSSLVKNNIDSSSSDTYNDNFYKLTNPLGLTEPYSTSGTTMYISPESYNTQLQAINKKYGKVNSELVNNSLR